ncbi:MAG: hypothetical protein ACFCGT_27125 [Sandaracinaceae bacterium]
MSADDDEEQRAARSRALRFSADERALLRKGCLKYRRGIPTYLQSSREELSLIASILEKLGDDP